MEHKVGYGFYIKVINHRLKAVIDENLKKFNLTKSQNDIIHFLYTHRNEVVIQKDLENHFNISNPTVTGLLNRLEQKGYIVRVPSDKDKRIKIIQPTNKVLTHHQEIKESILRIETKMAKGLTEEEQEMLYTLLEKVKNNLEEEE